jgi:hypothetical protein
MHRKVVERWLYGALTGTAQLFSSDSTIFPLLSGTDCLCAPGGEQECTPMAMCHWKVAVRVEGCDVLPDGGLWGLLQSPNCKKRVPNSHPPVAADY